jgi:uncharacterized membrane protein
MNKEKWLLKEVDKWQQQDIISNDTADNIKALYQKKQNTNLLVLIFSIIGSILIGTGIILISAKNWYDFPIWVRVLIAFTPLVLSQILSVFVLQKKYDSAPWREGTAMFMTLSVFTAIALVGQIFHLPGDFGSYVLTCGLLSLPIIYILKAVSPVIIYCYTIVNWGVLFREDMQSTYGVLWLLFLFALILPFAIYYIAKERTGVKGQYLAWVASVVGFVVMWIVSLAFSGYTLTTLSFYFAMLYVIDKYLYSAAAGYSMRPFKIAGTLGILVIFFILSYSRFWNVYNFNSHNDIFFVQWPMALIILGMIIFSGYSFYRYTDKDMLNVIMIISPMVIGLSRLATDVTYYNMEIGTFLMIVCNLFLLTVGVLMIRKGVNDISIAVTNFGMAVTCLLIILRFFDWDLDFLTRGISFVALGTIFLIVNLRIVRKRKAVSEA